MYARSPRSETLSTGVSATSSMNRTHRVQRMQRFGHVEHVRPEVLDRVVALGVLGVAGAGAAFLEHVVLQLALAGLVADRAVERVVDQQELQHALARLLGACRC